MKPVSKILRIAKIYGIVITLFMLSTFGLVMVGEFVEEEGTAFKELGTAFFNWYDDPTAYFLTYVIGYILICWKPIWGSLIIIAASFFSLVINLDNSGFMLFAIPTSLVGFLYLVGLYEEQKQVK
jgi:hypothetical protein